MRRARGRATRDRWNRVTLEIEALLASLDGRLALRARATGTEPATVGREVATRLLDEYGGRALLEDVA